MPMRNEPGCNFSNKRKRLLDELHALNDTEIEEYRAEMEELKGKLEEYRAEIDELKCKLETDRHDQTEKTNLIQKGKRLPTELLNNVRMNHTYTEWQMNREVTKAVIQYWVEPTANDDKSRNVLADGKMQDYVLFSWLADALSQNGVVDNHRVHCNDVIADLFGIEPSRVNVKVAGMNKTKGVTQQFVGLRLRDLSESDEVRAVRKASLLCKDMASVHEWYRQQCMQLDVPAECRDTMLKEITARVERNRLDE